MAKQLLKIIAAILLVLPAACVKDAPDIHQPTAPASRKGVYVVCEGKYTSGDASLYLYQEQGDSIFGDVYQAVNGKKLGDVFQSMSVAGRFFVLCINNSGKVVLLDTATAQLVSELPVPLPRYAVGYGSSKVFVSAWKRNKLYVIDSGVPSVADSILLPSKNPEGMCLLNGLLYVTSWDTGASNLLVIAPATNRLIQTINTGYKATHDVLADKEGMLWVLSGNKEQGVPAALLRIDPSTGTVLNAFAFPLTAEPVKLCCNSRKDTLYFLGIDYYGNNSYNGVFQMSIGAHQLPATPFIAASGLQYFYGLGIHPSTGNIYVGDPRGFNQRGAVLVYNTAGALQKTMMAGVGPNGFLFF